MSIIDQFSLSQFSETDTAVLTNVPNATHTTSAATSSLESSTGVGAYFADILASLQGAAGEFMENETLTSSLQTSSLSTAENDTSAASTLATGAAASILFASLLSMDDATDNNETSLANASPETIISDVLSADESIAQIQQQLMASLNANLFGGLLGDSVGVDSASGLMAGLGSSFSDESISTMQSNLLTSLHSSLFSGLANDSAVQTSGAQQGVSAASKSVVNEAQSSYSFLQDISKVSFGEDGFGLNELFDTVNIAQHIPIMSSLYQDMTGEGMSAAASLAGGFLYGGPTGLALSAADLMVKGVTGTTVSDAIVDFDYAGTFFGDLPEATVAQEALKSSDAPIEESTNAYQFVSRLF